ncbi:MAG: hypothetical protein LM574_00430 [Archaeoglobus sp.]|nr:hypothetical protein [Archaeoglobus sp.]
MIEKLLMIVIPQALERWRVILAGIRFFIHYDCDRKKWYAHVSRQLEKELAISLEAS